MKISLTKLISKQIDEERAKKIRDNSYWHGSDMGICPRKRFFKRQGIGGEEFDERTKRVFKVGEIFHEWLQELLKQQGVLLSCEEELKDDKLNYKGHYDALVSFENDHLILYDFKTVNSMAFSYWEKGGFPEYHKSQLMSYIYFLRKQKFPLLEEGRMFYISKDDFRVVEIPVLFNDEWEKKTEDELILLNNYWERGELPPRIAKDYHNISEPEAWQCAKRIGKARKDGSYLYKPFCPYFETCWKKEPDKEIEVFINR